MSLAAAGRFGAAAFVALLLGPLVVGLGATLAEGLGLVALDGEPQGAAAALATLAATPGLGRSVALSLGTGLVGGALALLGAATLLAAFHDRPVFGPLRRLLSPLLALPHAAAAFGLAALVAPSGLLARLVSPWATGWQRPPDLLIVNDLYGLTLTLGLAAKEAPFLLLMLLGAQAQADMARSVLAARTLGHGRIGAFAFAAWPRLYAQIRLPMAAVVVYGVSAVDMALILGPTSPPPLSVVALRLATDADLALRAPAALAALLQAAVALVALALWLAVERIGRAVVAMALLRGTRATAGPARLGDAAGWVAAAIPGAVLLGGLASLALWSVAGPWPFPAALPAAFTAESWHRAFAMLAGPLATTVLLGLAASLVATILVVLALANEDRLGRRPGPALLLVLYAPLLVPQIAFLFGLSVVMIRLGLDRGWAGLVLAHLVFVCPYAYLSLAGPWHALDERLPLVARGLGAGPWRVLLALRLPMLLRPLATTLALGFAVSVALYLPTKLTAGGRIATVTTEAVALSAGLDRRLIGAVALTQAILPAMVFALAMLVPRLVHRHRRALLQEAAA